MRSSASWSIGLGRWGGVQLRVHMFFWLFAAFTLFLCFSRAPARDNLPWVVLAGIGIWFVSLVLHELGHLLTALRFGGDSDQIVIFPFGGLHPPRSPVDPRHELAMHLAGPLVNAALCLIAGIVVAIHDKGNVAGLLNPLAPKELVAPSTASWLLIGAKLTCWINYVLWLANLLPAFPFDGGRAMRAALLASRPDLSPARAVLLVTSLAKIVAFILIIVALLMWSSNTNPLIPVWFSLVLLAILLYFSARHEEERAEDVETEDQLFGYDFSEGYTSLERSSSQTEQAGPFRRWLQERREARQEQQREVELEEERRVDEVLGRLHEHGMDSLSIEERLLLQRVSQRYRHRQERSN